jgi:hypothetical protein
VKGKQEEGTMWEAPHLPLDRTHLMEIRVFILQRELCSTPERKSLLWTLFNFLRNNGERNVWP